MGVWIYLRHWINWKILWATLTEFRTVGPFELNWETQQYKCWISQYITFSLLVCLQAVNLFWLFLILRIAKNFVFAKDLADERSDDEEEEEEEPKTLVKGPTKALESSKINRSKPIVLVNGEPVERETDPDGVRERKKRG